MADLSHETRTAKNGWYTLLVGLGIIMLIMAALYTLTVSITVGGMLLIFGLVLILAAQPFRVPPA